MTAITPVTRSRHAAMRWRGNASYAFAADRAIGVRLAMLHFAGSCGSRLACLCVACLSEYLPAALRRRHGARSQARRQAGLGRGCPEPSIEDGELNQSIKGTLPFYSPDYPQPGRIRSTRVPACRSSLDFAALRSGRTVDTFASPTIRIESEARAQSHDLPVVRHGPLPPPYRIGLRHDVGALSARRAAGEFCGSALREVKDAPRELKRSIDPRRRGDDQLLGFPAGARRRVL